MMSREYKKIILVACVLGVLSTIVLIVGVSNYSEKNYKLANNYFTSGEYSKAQAVYLKLGRYKDSEELAEKASKYITQKEIYNKALDKCEKKDYQAAIELLNGILDFEDSKEQIKNNYYLLAKDYYNADDFDTARDYFFKADGYGDSSEYLKKIEVKMANTVASTAYNEAINFLESGDYESALELFIDLGDYRDSEDYVEKCQKVLERRAKARKYATAKNFYNYENYESALELFIDLGDYKNSEEYVKKCYIMLKRSSLCNTLAAGVRNSVAITSEGRLLVAGTNDNGQKNVNGLKRIVSVDTYGYFVVGLTDSGKVVYSGKSEDEVNTNKWEDIVDVACGENFIIGLDKYGNVHGTGHKTSGQINVSGSNWKDVIAIDAGWSFTVALTKNGELLFAGASAREQVEEYEIKKSEWRDVINISASGGGPHRKQRGKGHTVGLRKNGTVVAVGDNRLGQCKVSEWKDIVKIATGDWYTIGLDKYGKVYMTGQNDSSTHTVYKNESILSNIDRVVDVAAGFGQSLFLKEDGTLVVFGFDDAKKQSETSEWKNIKMDLEYKKFLCEKE